MKFSSPRASASLFLLALAGLGLSSASAASLMVMTFDNGGANINETTGWNGTTAPGGSLATGLTVSSGMKIYGDFTAQNANDVFHVDNWHTTNSSDTRVGLTVDALSGYTFSLGGGAETFSTRVHQHPVTGTDIFNLVTLFINGNAISSQAYTPEGGPQTLTWNLGVNPALNNLTSATFDLKFSGTSNPTASNHGPEWSLADDAFVSFTGTVAAVPETSHTLLTLIGMGLVMVRRRR